MSHSLSSYDSLTLSQSFLTITLNISQYIPSLSDVPIFIIFLSHFFFSFFPNFFQFFSNIVCLFEFTAVPEYCTAPSSSADLIMQQWISKEMKVRCHPTRLWVPCDYSRGYDAFVPCPQELMDKLAEDYAVSKGWCDFTHKAAGIAPLVRVDSGAARAFRQPSLEQGKAVRLAFMLTVYSDAPFVERLFSRLYGSEHYYLLHVDPSGATADFERKMRIMAAKYSNVYLSKDIPIVYGAATATILLTKAMAWFLKYASGWDYFVPVTGSDYPLIPLHRLEKILYTKQVKTVHI